MSWVLQKMGWFTPKADKACLVPSDGKYSGDLKNICCPLEKSLRLGAQTGVMSAIF